MVFFRRRARAGAPGAGLYVRGNGRRVQVVSMGLERDPYNGQTSRTGPGKTLYHQDVCSPRPTRSGLSAFARARRAAVRSLGEAAARDGCRSRFAPFCAARPPDADTLINRRKPYTGKLKRLRRAILVPNHASLAIRRQQAAQAASAGENSRRAAASAGTMTGKYPGSPRAANRGSAGESGAFTRFLCALFTRVAAVSRRARFGQESAQCGRDRVLTPAVDAVIIPVSGQHSVDGLSSTHQERVRDA